MKSLDIFRPPPRTHIYILDDEIKNYINCPMDNDQIIGGKYSWYFLLENISSCEITDA